jgi:hypothetical protein
MLSIEALSLPLRLPQRAGEMSDPSSTVSRATWEFTGVDDGEGDRTNGVTRIAGGARSRSFMVVSVHLWFPSSASMPRFDNTSGDS